MQIINLQKNPSMIGHNWETIRSPQRDTQREREAILRGTKKEKKIQQLLVGVTSKKSFSDDPKGLKESFFEKEERRRKEVKSHLFSCKMLFITTYRLSFCLFTKS